MLRTEIVILGDIPIGNTLFQKYKMNAILHNFLLAGDQFLPEMHLRHSGFSYSACGPFT